MAALEPEESENLARWSELANLYYEEELYAEAAEIYERMRAIEATLESEPVLGHSRPWSHLLDRAMLEYGRALGRRGEGLEAYHLLRTYGHAAEAELVLSTHELFEAAEQRYREEWEAAAARLAQGGETGAEGDAGAEGKDEEDFSHWREAGIRLADVLQFRKRWDEVLAIYEELAERLDGDLALHEQVVALHQRAGRMEDAIDRRYRIIAKKRELNRHARRSLAPEGRVVQPLAPDGVGDSRSNFGASRIVYLGRVAGQGGSGRGPSGLYELGADYMKIVQAHLDRRESKRAADVLAKLARDDATTFRWMSWEVVRVIQNFQLGADGLPIMRLLYSYQPDNESTALEYGRVLVKAGNFDEARKVFERLVNRGTRRSWAAGEARADLDRLSARLGLANAETLETLRAAVEADPKNVRSRMELARGLFREREFEAALAEGLVAEELAPHQEEVGKFVTDTLTVLGRQEELEQRLLAELDEEKDASRRFEIAVTLADWMADRGEADEAIDALFERVVEHRWRGTLQYAPSSWWIERGRLERGRAVLEREIERMGPDSDSSSQARNRLGELALYEGELDIALDEVLERFEKASDHQSRLSLFGELAAVLRMMWDPQAAQEAARAYAERQEGVRPVLVLAAAELAWDRLDALEERLAGLVEADEQYLYFYPALVDLARQRGDDEAALGYLQRLAERGLASRSRTTNTSIGSISEEAALKAEIGSLLLELGRVEEAREVWSGMFSDQDRDQQRAALASLYEQHELLEEALAVLAEMKDESKGAEQLVPLRQMAEIEYERGNLEQALRLAGEAEILSGHGAQERLFLAKLHRASNSLEEYFEALAQDLAGDADDSELARVVISLAVELGRQDVAERTVESLVHKPDQAQGLKPYLLRMRLLHGDESGALEVYEDVLQGNVNEWQRQRYGGQLARALAWRGELERADEVLRRSYSDPEGFEAVLALGQQMEELELFEAALEKSDAAIALDPLGAAAWALRARMLVELERPREALDVCYEVLENPDLQQHYDGLRFYVPALAQELGEEARLAQAYAPVSGELSTAYRLGLVRASSYDFAGAREPLEDVLGRVPEHQGALRELARVAVAEQRFDEAEELMRRFIGILDRERNLSRESWSADSAILDWVNWLRELRLLAGDPEGALALDEERLGERFRTPRSYSYSYGNNPFQRYHQRLWWLERHGFYSEYVEAQRLVQIFDRWNRAYGQAEAQLARYRAGDVAVLDELWLQVREPGRALVGKAADQNSVYYTTSNASQVDPRLRTLRQLFAEAGRLDELETWVRAELELAPQDPVMQPLLGELLREAERWEDWMVLLDEDLAGNPDDDEKRIAKARALMRLGRYDEAVEGLEAVYRNRIADVPEGAGNPYMAVMGSGSVQSKRGSPGRVRFAWSGNSPMTARASTAFFGGSGELELEVDALEKEARTLLMIAKRALGAEEEASRLEDVARSMDMLQGWGRGRSRTEMMKAYADWGFIEDAERIGHAILADRPEADEETRVYGALCALFREHDDAGRRRGWAERWLEHLDEMVAENPFDPYNRIARAQLLFFELEDAQRARADLDQVLAWTPRASAAHALLAWMDLTANDAQGALERFEEAERLAWMEGRPPDEELLYGRGFALAAAGQAEAARPVLRRALAAADESRHAHRARELLQ